MERLPLRFTVSLRTGFFKTERYTLVVSSDALAFVKDFGSEEEEGIAKEAITKEGVAKEDIKEEIKNDSGKERKTVIPYSEVRAVTFCSSRPAEIEVKTFSETYVGTFLEAKEAESAAAVLRFLLGKRFTAV